MVVPPGFRFQPTDEELLHYYLGPKAVGQPLPISIPTLDVYNMPPKALLPAAFHGTDGNIYCFAHTSRCSNKGGGRFKRAVGQAGSWNSNRTSKIRAGRGLVVGYRKSLSFQTSAAAADGGRMKECTGWVMDEYRLAEGNAAPEVQDLVLCKIRNRKEDALSPEDGTVEQDNAALEELLGSEGEMATMIPVGFRFDPSDRELVCYYLRRKIEGRPFPLAIPTLGVYDAAPWELPQDSAASMASSSASPAALAAPIETNALSALLEPWEPGMTTKTARSSSGENWWATTRSYRSRPPGAVVGRRKNTGWVMHEYRLAERKGTSELQDIVFCKIRNRNEFAYGKRKREFSEDGGLLLEFTDGVEAAPSFENHACTSDGKLAACYSTSTSARPPSDDAASTVVVPLGEPAPGGDQDMFSVADMEELLQLLGDLGAAAELPGDHTDQTGNQCAALLESCDQTVREQPAPVQLIPHDLQLQQQQQLEQPTRLQQIPHGLPQEQHEGVIDPARMSRRGRKVWKALLKCMAGSPVEAAAEVEMIPRSQLHVDDLDWRVL